MSEREAGRALDSLVAEKLFGWKPEYGSPHWYSTDIAAAWQVVERMEKEVWMLTLINWQYYGDRSWTARFTSHPLGPKSVEVRAATAPLAICLAALAAVAPPRQDRDPEAPHV